MVQRQHRVGLAASEVRLQLHHRITASSGQPLGGAGQQRAQTIGQIGAGEELGRVAVFRRRAAIVHLGKIGRKLGLLEIAGRHVLVRLDHLAPRQQPGHGVHHDLRPRRLFPLFVPLQLGELGAQDRVTHRADLFGCLACAHRLQQPPHAVQRPLGVVIGELAVMGQGVAHIDQLVHHRAVRPVQYVAERLIPHPLHDFQQLLRIQRELAVPLRPPFRKARDHLLRPSLAHPGLKRAQNERVQPVLHVFHAFENILTRALCHARIPLDFKSHLPAAVRQRGHGGFTGQVGPVGDQRIVGGGLFVVPPLFTDVVENVG